MLPTVNTSEVTTSASTTATVGGTVTSDGGAYVIERGIYWSATQNPESNGSKVEIGNGIGSFSIGISDLIPNTTYFAKAYAINSKGTTYGNQVDFITAQIINKPTVTTKEIITFTTNSATVGGNVESDGNAAVTERGIFWSTSPNPESTGTKVQIGTGSGTFSSTLSGLIPNTQYFVKAYAINSQGLAFGNQVSFTTVVSDAIITEPFNGNVLNTSIWQIYDNTFYHESGLEMKINDTLIIKRGTTNDNNMFYGIVTKNQYTNFKEASVDVWLSSLHNWQDHKVTFCTPVATIGYYNYEGKWFASYTTSSGVSALNWFATGYLPDTRYSLRIRISGNELIFEWDKGAGFIKVFSTTDFSTELYQGLWPNLNKRVMLSNGDRGYTKYDNLILK